MEFCNSIASSSGHKIDLVNRSRIAEAVEKVGVIENQATFDQSSLVFGYNDSR
jgi:hypothetical protein